MYTLVLCACLFTGEADEIAVQSYCGFCAKTRSTFLTNRLGEEFAAQGGFKERMSEVRSEARMKSALGAEGEAPKCPVCGGAMRLRKTKADNRAFWGCGDYPLCKGVVECRKKS